MRFAKKKIIVADDSQSFILSMSSLLNKMGFSVIPAEDAYEAIKLIKLRTPDLILMDRHMPGIDGLEGLRLLKADKLTKDIPVVMVSADSSRESIKECEDLGCSGYLVKPIDIVELHRVLQDTLIVPSGQMRRNLRVDFSGRVKLLTGEGDELLFAKTISEGGIYIRRKEPLPVGSDIEMEITVGDNMLLELRGTVIYISKATSDLNSIPSGMAIEFRDMRDEDKSIISVFVKRLLEI